MDWAALPIDLFPHIFRHVSLSDLAAVASTNSNWAQAIRGLLRPFRTLATQPSRVRLLVQNGDDNVLLPEDAIEEPLHPMLLLKGWTGYGHWEESRRVGTRLWLLITFADEQTGGPMFV